MLSQATYIWIDGARPTKRLRAKVRVLDLPEGSLNVANFPRWGFDGSSTYQAQGEDSDLILEPVCAIRDPIVTQNSCLVLCEVFNADGTPHETNTRAKLRALIDDDVRAQDPWIGFEQEYTLFQGSRPLGSVCQS